MSLNSNIPVATAESHRLIPLCRLAGRQRAAVAEVVGRTEQVQRLKELGFRPGVQLEMVRSGSPCIVRLQGHTLCIRGNELVNVLVECED